jgi:hypothetical protein
MIYPLNFGRPVSINVDLVDHPQLCTAADRMTILPHVVLLYLGERLTQMIPLAKIEHLWQVEEVAE